MKLAKFQLHQKDYEAACRLAEAAGVSFSEFARQALIEKSDRQRVLASVQSAQFELAELLADIRQENTRARRELGEDAAKHLELQRREAAASLRKNEELNKTLVMELARSLGGGGKPSAPASRGDWSNLD